MANTLTSSGDDVLHLSSVASSGHPGGSETITLPSLRTTSQGLSKQEVKVEDVPVPASGDQGSVEDVILLVSDDYGGV